MKLLFLLCPLGVAADWLSQAQNDFMHGDLAAAQEHANQAVDEGRHSKGASAIDAPLELLAQIFRREKRFADAAQAERQRIDLWTGLINENAVIVGRVLGSLASIEQQSGDLDQAEADARRALAIMSSSFPEKPPAAQAALDLAGILRAEGRTGEADQLRAQAQKILPDTPGAVHAGHEVSTPRLLAHEEPEYSEEARAKKLQGTIQLRFVVDINGTPIQIAVLRPLGCGLDEKAIDAVSHWKFAPGTKNGTAVPVITQAEVTFHLL
jgi:TonB family protein